MRKTGARLLAAVGLMLAGVVGGIVAGIFVFGAVWSHLYLPHHNHGDPVPWFLPIMAIPPFLVAALTVAICTAAVSPGVLLLLRPWRLRRSEDSDSDAEHGLAWVGLDA